MPPCWPTWPGRPQDPLAYVCGPTSFVETAGAADRARLPGGPGQDRTVRRHGRRLMEALDGNAIGGLLHEVFGTEMTAAEGTCAACGARAGGAGRGVPGRTGHRGPLPPLRQRAHGDRRRTPVPVRRPERAGQPKPYRTGLIQASGIRACPYARRTPIRKHGKDEHVARQGAQAGGQGRLPGAESWLDCPPSHHQTLSPIHTFRCASWRSCCRPVPGRDHQVIGEPTRCRARMRAVARRVPPSR